jgi:hypothetical protein
LEKSSTPLTTDPGVRVFLDVEYRAQAMRKVWRDAIERNILKNTELQSSAHKSRRTLLAASDPLNSNVMLVPGHTPTIDPVSGQPTVDAWFFIQRGVAPDQMIVQTSTSGTMTTYYNDQPVECGVDISDACRYTVQVEFETTCHDIIGFGAETFSNVVWCAQRVSFTPTNTSVQAQSIGITLTIDILKAVPSLSVSASTSLTARLWYIDETEKIKVVNPIELPDVSLHYSVGRESLLDPNILQAESPDFVVEGEDMCTFITATPRPDPGSGKVSMINADLLEVAMCTQSSPLLLWEKPPTEENDLLFSCMSYEPNARVHVIYSQRFDDCSANNSTGSRLGGCCPSDEASACGVYDRLNTRFQCKDNATDAFTSSTCALPHPTTFMPGNDCPVGSTCPNGGGEPLELIDFPVAPVLFPSECLNVNGTALVDCTSSTVDCLDAAGCAPSSNRLAFCMKVPTFRDFRNKTDIIYEFRVDLTVVDFHQTSSRRRLLLDSTSMEHQTVSVTKRITAVTRDYLDSHPQRQHWLHAPLERVGLDMEQVLAVAPIIIPGCLVVGGLLLLKALT